METQELRDLVGRHRVVFEVHPENAIVDGRRVQIGFDIHLYGTHGEAVLEHREPMPVPGCARCHAVWENLEQIAAAVLPPADRETTFRIEEFSGTLTFDKKRRRGNIDRPDVELVIEARHREGYNRPVDACETRCVQDLVKALRSLGVQEGSWSDWTAQVFRADH